MNVEQLIDSWARKISDLRLELPAMFFIEAHLPVSGLLHHLGLAFEPAVTPLFGAERIKPLMELIGHRENLTELLQRIEHYSSLRGQSLNTEVTSESKN